MTAILLLVIVLTAFAAQANATTSFTYTGNDYTGYWISDTSLGGDLQPAVPFDVHEGLGLRLTALAVLEDIASDFTGTLNATQSLSLSYSSGPITVTYTRGSNLPFVFGAFSFSDGELTGANIFLAANSGITIFSNSARDMLQDVEFGSEAGVITSGNAVLGNPGTWARVAPVPVPGAAFFLAPAIAGLALTRRRT